MEQLDIDGGWLFTPRVIADNRGDFHEWFRGAEFLANLGYRLDVAQVNCSVSRRGAIRGIHFSQVPPGQAKYIGCIAGEILDVIVDVRTGSATFGQWQAVRLSEENRQAVFLSEGLGHAFMALSRQATALYLCSTPYSAAVEQGLHPLDPDLGITWPADVPPILSERDAAAPSLREAQSAGCLPDISDCRAHAERLRNSVAQ